MSKTPKIYDACFISFNRLVNDARTLNHARSLAKSGKIVCIAAMGSKSDYDEFKSEAFEFYRIPLFEKGSAWKRWLGFNRFVKYYFPVLISGTYWAEDVYSLYPAGSLKKMHGGSLIYDSREIYSSLGPLSGHPLKQKILTNLELRLVRSVDRFIVTGKLDGEFLAKHLNTRKPFHLIMNLPYYRQPVKSDILRETYNIPPNYKILLYQGMLLPGRGIAKIVAALKFLPDCIFCILGEGSYKDEIEREAVKNGVSDRVILCGSIEYDKLHEYSCSADAGCVLIEPVTFSYELALPNKLFEYCMAGLPSLVSDLPAMRQVIERYPFGELIPHDSSPEQIAAAVYNLLDDDRSLKYKSAAADASLEYCYENHERELLKILGE